MRLSSPIIGIGLPVLLSLAGFVGFILLFLREMNVYWFILAPVIFAVYQIPAVVVYAVWKRRFGKKPEPGDEPRENGPADSSESEKK